METEFDLTGFDVPELGGELVQFLPQLVGLSPVDPAPLQRLDLGLELQRGRLHLVISNHAGEFG